MARSPRSSDASALDRSIEAVRRGDTSAFDEIVRRYETLVLRVAYRMTGNREDAMDVAQDTFLRVYRSLGGFRTGRRFEAWIYRIVVNVAIDHLERRRAGRTVTLEEEGAAGTVVEDGSESPHQAVERSEMQREVGRLLGDLPPRLRAVFVLRDIEGVETVEVARILGCRRVTVRRHSMEARERMRTLLNQKFPGLKGSRDSGEK